MTLRIYRETRSFPREELFGLTRQLRTASASIPMNIAEGCGRRARMERAHFFDFACGSASEVDYQLELSRDLGYLDQARYAPLAAEITEIRKMLARLAQSTRDNA